MHIEHESDVEYIIMTQEIQFHLAGMLYFIFVNCLKMLTYKRNFPYVLFQFFLGFPNYLSLVSGFTLAIVGQSVKTYSFVM